MLAPTDFHHIQGGHPMATITTKDGTQIFYKDWGTGQPLFFHHGWPLSADDWDAQMMYFLERGYRVIAHDRRGHGRSTQTWFYPGLPHGMPTTHADQINADLLAFIKGTAKAAE